jgi:hypothetical protein
VDLNDVDEDLPEEGPNAPFVPADLLYFLEYDRG